MRNVLAVPLGVVAPGFKITSRRESALKQGCAAFHHLSTCTPLLANRLQQPVCNTGKQGSNERCHAFQVIRLLREWPEVAARGNV